MNDKLGAVKVILYTISDAAAFLFATPLGIVRSLYGDAVHRVAKKGDVFTVWVEQSGGLTVKDPAAF
jgi:hypothetical protein